MGVFLYVFSDAEQDYSSLQMFSHNPDIRMNGVFHPCARAGGLGEQSATEWVIKHENEVKRR